MPFPILAGKAIVDTGFSVANSCRFNDGDSPKLDLDFSSDGTLNKWTFSMWFKRSTLGTAQRLFCCLDTGMDDYIKFDTDDQLEWTFDHEDGTNKGILKPNRLFRDVSTWYHLVCRLDTTDGTAGDRMRMYINGVEETSFATDTNPTQNETGDVGRDNDHFIGSATSSQYFDGYIAEVCMINNQSLAPTSFGEFNSDSPTIWQPIDVSGLTAGTNGFYLDFEDSSNLGNDIFGGTDWTETNIVAVDQSSDTPTLNYSTMNPLQNIFGVQTFADGNLQINSPSGNASAPHSTFGVANGRWYVEAKLDSAGSDQTLIGVSSNEATDDEFNVGKGATSYGYDSGAGKIYNNNDSGTTYGNGYGAGDILGIYLDLEDNKLYFSIDGTLQNSGTGHSITAAASTELGFYFFSGHQWDNQQSCQWSFNFGSPTYANSSSNTDDNGYGDFEYSPNITGDGSAKSFYAVNSKNLAEFG